LEGYFTAKWNLVTSGVPVFMGKSVLHWAREFGLTVPANVEVVHENSDACPADIGVFTQKPWCNLFALAHRWWVETGRDPEVIRGAAREFVLSPHRIEEVATVRGVRFVDDSKATNPHAALAAIEGVGRPLYWLGGGSPKGENLAALASAIALRIDSGDTFGTTGKELAELLRAEGCVAQFHQSLDKAFEAAVSRARRGGTVLLSPGFASFDQFKGYADRGSRFRGLVKEFSTRRSRLR